MATKSQDFNTIFINTKQKSFHINSVFLFSKTYYDSKKYYMQNFTSLIQLSRTQLGQYGQRAGVQTP